MSPSKRNSSTIAGAPGVIPSNKNNSRNFSKDSPSVGRALNSFTREGWSLNHLHGGVPASVLQTQGTRYSPRAGGCDVELGNAGVCMVWMGTGMSQAQGRQRGRIPSTPGLCPSAPTQPPSTQGSVQEHIPHLLPLRTPWDGGTIPAQTRDRGPSAAHLFVPCVVRKAAWPGSACWCCWFSQHSWRSRTGPRGTQPVPAPPGSLPARQPVLLVLGCLRAWQSLLCKGTSQDPLPLPLLNRSHDRGRGSGRLTEHRPGALQERPGHPHAGTASSRSLSREKDIALKFSAGCLCKYPPSAPLPAPRQGKARTGDVQA